MSNGAPDDSIRDTGTRRKYVIESTPNNPRTSGPLRDGRPGVTSLVKNVFQRKPRPDTSVTAFLQVANDKCSKLEVWPFLFGVPFLGVAAGLSGAFINYQFRKILYLAHHGRITSFIALGVVPISTGVLLHGAFVTDNLLKRRNECATCLQVRGGLIQAGIGVGYPFVLAPLVALPISKRLAKYSVPKFSRENIPVLLAYAKDLVSPLKQKILVLIATNLLLGMGITAAEQYSYYKHVRPKLIEQAEAAPDPSHPSEIVRTRETRSVIVH